MLICISKLPHQQCTGNISEHITLTELRSIQCKMGGHCYFYQYRGNSSRNEFTDILRYFQWSHNLNPTQLWSLTAIAKIYNFTGLYHTSIWMNAHLIQILEHAHHTHTQKKTLNSPSLIFPVCIHFQSFLKNI